MQGIFYGSGLFTGKIIASEDFVKHKGTRCGTEQKPIRHSHVHARHIYVLCTPLLPAFKQIKEALVDCTS